MNRYPLLGGLILASSLVLLYTLSTIPARNAYIDPTPQCNTPCETNYGSGTIYGWPAADLIITRHAFLDPLGSAFDNHLASIVWLIQFPGVLVDSLVALGLAATGVSGAYMIEHVLAVKAGTRA